MQSFTRVILLTILLASALTANAYHSGDDQYSNTAEYADWIEQMRDSRKGPFERIVWFCNDGKILRPKAYACTKFGGGIQHGKLNRKAETLRAAGYPIANVYADYLRPNPSFPSTWEMPALLVERFLADFDNGWIFRGARYYRGALQAEDESRGGAKVLTELLKQDQDSEQHFLLMREAAKFLPGASGKDKLNRARGLASLAAKADPGFTLIKNKIHNWPDAGDIARVRDYANRVSDYDLSLRFDELISQLETSYSIDSNFSPELRDLASRSINRRHAEDLRSLANAFAARQNAEKRYAATNRLMYLLRDMMPLLGSAEDRRLALKLSLEAERVAYIATTEITAQLRQYSRSKMLSLLYKSAQGLYGMGFITQAELAQLQLVLLEIMRPQITLGQWLSGLQDFALVNEWAVRRFDYYFGESMRHLAAIEPLANEYIVERLRGSPAIFVSQVLEMLQTDGNIEAGVENQLFGKTVGTGLRALNPGLAQGVLLPTPKPGQDYREDGIYLLPNTIATLPKVAGILTLAEGNALSHVQLLARNLGIPNVVVDRKWTGQIRRYYNRPVVMAASPAGAVSLDHDKGQLDELFAAAKPKPLSLPLDKLDFSKRLWTLDQLSATNSGVQVGPKAAKLAELHHLFPGTVSAAITIPFGYFNDLLQRIDPQSGITKQQWLKAQYRELELYKAMDPRGYQQRLDEVLSNMRAWIKRQPLDPNLVNELRQLARAEFGAEGNYGVFVRSDTNVEDLPNFSGAGLNKTVHHVVGFDKLLEAIKVVWASPFKRRAFNWRQAVLDHPEHVYASVLLHKSVAVDMSGVAVTMDMRSGDTNYTTVVANEGVGGGVDGQPAEAVLMTNNRRQKRLLASATATVKRVLKQSGGSMLIRASANDNLLTGKRLGALRKVVAGLNSRYPESRDANGEIQPLDIEYGFTGNQLALFQVRPFVRNQSAERHQFLLEMDAELRKKFAQTIDTRASINR